MDMISGVLDEQRWHILSKELKVAVEIQKMIESGYAPYFSSLVRDLENKGMTRTTTHNAIDNLIDLGTIRADWDKVDSNWVRKFTIADGENKDFIRKLARELYR